METRLASAVCEASLLRSTLDGKSKALDVLGKQYAEQTAELAGLRAELAQLRDQKGRAESGARHARLNEERVQKRFEFTLNELQTLVTQHAVLEQQLKAANAKVQQFRSAEAMKAEWRAEWLAEFEATDDNTWRRQFLALRREMDSIATDLELRMPEMKRLDRQCVRAQEEATKLKTELNQATARNKELETALKSAESAARDMRDRQASSVRRIADLREQVCCLLSEKMLARKLSPDERTQLISIRQECECVPKDLIGANFVLFRSVAEAQSQNERLLQTCRSMAAVLDEKINLKEVEQITTALAELRPKYDALKEECEQSKRTNEELRTRLETERPELTPPELSQPLQALLAPVPDLSGQLAESEARLNDAERAKRVVDEQLASLRLDNTNARVQLENASAAYESAVSENKSLSNELADKTRLVETLSAQLGERDAALKRLVAELLEHDAAASEKRDELASVVKDLREVVSLHPNAGPGLQKQLDEQKQRDNELVEQVNNLEDQVVQLQEDCSKQTAARADIAQKLAASEKEVKRLENAVKQADEQLNSTKVELQMVRKNSEAVSLELTDANAKLVSANTELATTKNELATTKAELTTTKAELSASELSAKSPAEPAEPEEPVYTSLREKLVANTSESDVVQFASEILETEQTRVKQLVKTKIKQVQQETEEKCQKRFDIKSKLVAQKLGKLEETKKDLEAKVADLIARNRRLKGGLPEDDSSAPPAPPAPVNAFGVPGFSPVVNAFSQDAEKRPSSQDSEPKKPRTD